MTNANPLPSGANANDQSSGTSTMPTRRAQIYISYSRSDRLAVDRLAADLRKRDFLVWVDVNEDGIEPGENWRVELSRQMSASEAVIACGSPDFLASSYCRAEVEQAQRENKQMFPVIIRRLNPGQSFADFRLDHLQFIDLTVDYDAGLKRLARVLPRPPFQFQLAVRRAGMIAGAALAVLVLLLAIRFVVSPNSALPTITPVPATATPHFEGNEIGVLVSYFALGDNTSPQDVPAANALIEGLSGALQRELINTQGKDSNAQAFPIHVLGPQGIDPVTGADSQTRLINAGSLAAHRDGTAIVVYGLISRNSTTSQFEVQPEFYVAPGKFFADAQDIVGSYALGKSILIDRGASVESQVTFVARTRALAYIVEGLSQHILRNYDRALSAYQLAMDVPDWADQDGREVLFALRGNSYMRLAEKAASGCKRDEVLQQVSAARTDYEKSQALNPKYIRSYAGLANTYYFSALWTNPGNDGCKERKVSPNFLQTALNYLDQAKQAGPTTDTATAKNLLLNEAQTRFVLWLTDSLKDNLYQEFVQTTDKIVGQYDRRDGIAAAFPVMEAYILRGFAHQNRGRLGPEEYRAAISEYEKALAIYEDTSFKDLLSPARAMTVQGWEGDCYLNLTDYPNAARYYNLALKTAQATNNQAAVGIYNDRLKVLDAKRLGTTTPPVAPSPTSTQTFAVF